MLRTLVLIIIFLLLLCIFVFGQNEAIIFFSSVDKQEIATDDFLKFKITLEGELKSNPKIELPKLGGDFDIIANSQSQKVSWQSGKKIEVFVWSLTLLPKRTGDITIDEAKLKIRQEVYATQPIKITVKQGRAPKELPGENKEDIKNEEDSQAITL